MASSTGKKRRNAAQLAADGFAAMVQKMGMADAIRYVQLYHQGTGDYTRERHDWLDQLGHEQIASLMASAGKEGPGKAKRPRRGKPGR